MEEAISLTARAAGAKGVKVGTTTYVDGLEVLCGAGADVSAIARLLATAIVRSPHRGIITIDAVRTGSGILLQVIDQGAASVSGDQALFFPLP